MTNSERNIASHASEPSKVNALLIGQLAQRQSTVLTRRGSQVQSPSHPPFPFSPRASDRSAAPLIIARGGCRLLIDPDRGLAGAVAYPLPRVPRPPSEARSAIGQSLPLKCECD